MNLQLPLTAPASVTVVRDGWDWLLIWCNVSGLILALAAIVLSVLIAAYTIHRNDQALAREQRTAFELGVLTRLIEVCGYNRPGALQVLQGLLAVLPEEDLPGIRAEAAQGWVPSNDALTPLMPEYLEAVDRRLRGG
jgi:hypothetical protein